MDISFTVFCLFFVFVQLWISLPRIKLAASNFAQWFIGILVRESPILGNIATSELTVIPHTGLIGANFYIVFDLVI